MDNYFKSTLHRANSSLSVVESFSISFSSPFILPSMTVNIDNNCENSIQTVRNHAYYLHICCALFLFILRRTCGRALKEEVGSIPTLYKSKSTESLEPWSFSSLSASEYLSFLFYFKWLWVCDLECQVSA